MAIVKKKYPGFLFKRLKNSVGLSNNTTGLEINNLAFSSMFENHPKPALIYDEETKAVTNVNKSATILYGISKKVFLGLTLKDIVLFENQEKVSVELLPGLYRQLHKNRHGQLLSVEITTYPVVYAFRKSILTIITDLTQQTEDEKFLKTLSRAVEQCPVSIIITDKNRQIEFVNAEFRNSMQYSLEDVKGRSPRIFNTGHLEQQTYDNMWQTLLLNKSWQGEFRNRKKDGTIIWNHANISTILDDSGEISNYILILEDITEKKAIFDELIASKEKAEESDKLKTAFLQNISHEIRTPMNAIIGFSDVLPTAFNNKDKLNYYTEIIKQRSSDLLKIIDDLLDIAKIESGKLSLTYEGCCLETIFRELEVFFVEYSKRVKKDHIRFNFSCQEEISTFFTDITKLKQVLINLITNAIKFTNSGSIELTCQIEGSNLLFKVKDSGIGIAEDKIAKIFMRFHQDKAGITNTIGGIGLGLAITKGILEILRGEIWVESELEKGSTFFFRLPYENKP